MPPSFKILCADTVAPLAVRIPVALAFAAFEFVVAVAVDVVLAADPAAFSAAPGIRAHLARAAGPPASRSQWQNDHQPMAGFV